MFVIGYYVMKRLSTLQHVQPVVKQCGFTKYDVEILSRFDMFDCKAMATPMDTNLKMLSDESSDLVDMTQYKQIIWVVDVSEKYKARYMLCCEHINPVSS